MQSESPLAEVNAVQISANRLWLTNHNVLENVGNTGADAVSVQVPKEGKAVELLCRLTTSHRLKSYEPAISRILDETARLWFGQSGGGGD
jgi:hypothetical protein